MNQYPAWKNLLVATVLAAGLLIALPNIFGKAPSLQVSREDTAVLNDAGISQVNSLLESASIATVESFVEDG
ncbi:MAG: protein translocase subunit SecD, partial [Gammaproteobacteria bacterium]